MRPVYWTPEAKARLKDIRDYIIEQHAPRAAQKVVKGLLLRARQLKIAPLSGHQMQDYPDDDLRELLEKPYRIIYRITEQQIEILTVMHYHQQLPATAKALYSIHKNS